MKNEKNERSLTGSLPSLTDADDTKTSTDRVRALLARPETAEAIVDRSAGIDKYVSRKTERLADLRRAAGLTQTQIADALGVTQPEISKLEGRETFMIDTFARFVAASGGRLRMVVEYDDGEGIEYVPSWSTDLAGTRSRKSRESSGGTATR